MSKQNATESAGQAEADSLRNIIAHVTPAMAKAGVQELREWDGFDEAYLARSIYMAMEYERLDALGKL